MNGVSFVQRASRVKESPENVSTKQSFSNGISSNGLNGFINGAAGEDSSGTFTGASIHAKPNE